MIALLCYHKNAEIIYPEKWIKQYRDSVLNQTYQEFDIIEANYGGGEFRIFEKSTFDNTPTDNFVQTLNKLLDKCFFDLGYDFVANSNSDDYFSLDRLEKQLPYIEGGYDIVSSNFHLLNEAGIYHTHNFEKLNIEQELQKNNNIICHPSVCYSKAFWQRGNRYVPEEIPFEDLKMWQRGILNSKFIVIPDHLVYHRVHDQSVCQSENR